MCHENNQKNNFLKIFEFYSNEREYSIVTELCAMGELFDEIVKKGSFNENYSAYILYQILSAVNYCHKMNIIHKDLKQENILIVAKNKDGYITVKVCDFGNFEDFWNWSGRATCGGIVILHCSLSFEQKL